MRLNSSHIPWAIFTVAATVAAWLGYMEQFHPGQAPLRLPLPEVFRSAPSGRNTFGATPIGLLYGSIALAIFFFAAALGVRKKQRLWRIGLVRIWLQGHIWLTTLTIPLVLFHCGFSFGGGHTTALMWLYIVVMVSGYFGLLMQHLLPRMMKDKLPREVVFEQIPHIRKRIYESALALRGQLFRGDKPAAKPAAAAAAKPAAPAADAPAVEAEPFDTSIIVLLEFLDRDLLPYLQKPAKHRLADQRVSDDAFRVLRLNVSDAIRSKTDDMQMWCDDARAMNLQEKLQHWLHGWLLIHVPVSFVLLVWTCWHAYIAWQYL